jgi:hypothetical protein
MGNKLDEPQVEKLKEDIEVLEGHLLHIEMKHVDALEKQVESTYKFELMKIVDRMKELTQSL